MTGQNPNAVAPRDVVTDQRRRNVLQCLDGRDDGLALADLANDVAALERETNRDDVAPAFVERVYVSLYHCHVPKLAEAGVVEYRADRNVVVLANEVGAVQKARPVTENTPDHRRA